MATSRGFFGIRRGSTKSHTFSELNGKQVTKDRVYTVKNPKSIQQMQQRLCMGQAGQAYKMFREIVNHSFEGKESIALNHNYFMSKNIDICKSLYKEHKGVGGDEYLPAPKNYDYFTCFKALLSEGSLTLNATLLGNPMSHQDTENALLMELGFLSGGGVLSENTTVNDFCKLFGVDKGDQLTFIFVVDNPVKSLVAQVYEENPSESLSQELVVKNIAPNRLFYGRVVIGDKGDQNIFEQYKNSKTLYTFNKLALNQTKSENYGDICFDVSTPNYIGIAETGSTSSDSLVGACIIRSKYNNGWKRSTSYLTINKGYCANSQIFGTYPIGGWGVESDTPYLNNAVK